MALQKKSGAVAETVAQLCPRCAMCCNGVLFKDVELQPGDSAAKLRTLELPASKSRRPKFPQPCAALGGCTCRIYVDRPARCREFECALLKSVAAGKTESAAALRIIHATHERAEKVRRLLREVGDHDEQVALSLRFKQTKRRFESSSFDEPTTEKYGELTLAVHDLHLLLREKFLPNPAG